jgi:hypothetical protein
MAIYRNRNQLHLVVLKEIGSRQIASAISVAAGTIIGTVQLISLG